MAAGIGMGFAAGGQMFNIGQQTMAPQPMAPPIAPPPIDPFYLYLNGQQVGPVQQQQLQQYVQAGQLTPDTMVWKNGMAQWQAAKTVPDLQQLFAANCPPPMPPAPPAM